MTLLRNRGVEDRLKINLNIEEKQYYIYGDAAHVWARRSKQPLTLQALQNSIMHIGKPCARHEWLCNGTMKTLNRCGFRITSLACCLCVASRSDCVTLRWQFYCTLRRASRMEDKCETISDVTRLASNTIVFCKNVHVLFHEKVA